METRERAERARTILEDEFFAGVISAIRERHLTAFESSAPDDPAAREQAHQMLWAITQLKTELQSAIDDEAMKKGRHRASD